MKRTGVASVLLPAVLATACQSTVPPAVALQQDRNKCTMYGITPGTQLFATCMMQQESDRENRRVANNQAMAGAFLGAAVLGVAAVAAANSGPYYGYRPRYYCGVYRCWWY